jgi:hypothetical protein
VVTDQNEWVYINDLYNLQGGYAYYDHSRWFPLWGSYYYYNNVSTYCYQQGYLTCLDRSSNDGGHPNFLLINGELVLIGPGIWCDHFRWLGYSCDEINAAIVALGGSASGYRVTQYNPAASGFPSLW